MSDGSRAIDAALRNVVAPSLKAEGFVFDGRRTFRRPHSEGRVDIISYQLGVRSLAGQFTVNIAQYRPGDAADEEVPPDRVTYSHCKRFKRLGELVPPSFPLLTRIPKIGFMFGARDRWWSHGADPSRTESNVLETLNLIREFGMPWLATQGDHPVRQENPEC